MKIGLVTVHKAPNYGANLQAYATWKFIQNLGHDCEILDLALTSENPRFPLMRPELYIKQKTPMTVILKMWVRKVCVFLGIKKPIYFPPEILPSAKLKFDKFNEFIKYSKKYSTVSAPYQSGTDYDILITGSDQVWNPQQPWAMEPMFLTFAKAGQRKISYAASIGVEELRENEKTLFAEWLKSYELISVRETAALTLLSEITGRTDIVKNIDPTFLLSQDEWSEFAIKPSISTPYILVFTLGHNQELIDYAIRIKAETGYSVKVVCLMAMPYEGDEYESITDACPRELIGYISKAELVLTDSFHGTVFSILMKAKNFYTYLFSYAKRNCRMIDLLALVGLSDHILDNCLSDSYHELSKRQIDFAKVSSIVDAERQRCGDWLTNVLSIKTK